MRVSQECVTRSAVRALGDWISNGRARANKRPVTTSRCVCTGRNFIEWSIETGCEQQSFLGAISSVHMKVYFNCLKLGDQPWPQPPESCLASKNPGRLTCPSKYQTTQPSRGEGQQEPSGYWENLTRPNQEQALAKWTWPAMQETLVTWKALGKVISCKMPQGYSPKV